VFLSIPRAAARRESQGTRDTTPVCASCFTARRRCTRYWRRAPCLGAQHTRGPLTQGPRGVLRTRRVDPLTGDLTALHWSSRCSALQVRFKSAPLVSGSRPVAEIEGLALDPLITSLRHCARHRGLTRRQAVVERRHCQQAASNDARVDGRVLVLGIMLIGMRAWRRSMSSAKRDRAEQWNCAMSRSAGESVAAGQAARR
jgi:hypothetical protein